MNVWAIVLVFTAMCAGDVQKQQVMIPFPDEQSCKIAAAVISAEIGSPKNCQNLTKETTK